MSVFVFLESFVLIISVCPFISILKCMILIMVSELSFDVKNQFIFLISLNNKESSLVGSSFDVTHMCLWGREFATPSPTRFVKNSKLKKNEVCKIFIPKDLGHSLWCHLCFKFRNPQLCISV
jgi:hypothetical protein